MQLAISSAGTPDRIYASSFSFSEAGVPATRYKNILRDLTDNYTPPANACVSHKVSFLKLKELDEDLAQHFFLENEILFAKTIQMEKELLAS